MNKKPSTQQIQIPDQILNQSLLNKQQTLTARSSNSSFLNPEKNHKDNRASLIKTNKIKNKNQHQKKKFSWPVYKKFFRYTLNRWKLALFGLFSTIVSGIVTSLIPFEVGNVLDCITRVRQQQDPLSLQQLNTQIIQLIVFIALLGITTYIRFTSTQYLQENLAIDMKMSIYSKFIKNDMYFFEQYKSGEFVSRLGTDINQAKSAISNNLTFLIRNFVTIISNIVILFVMSWKLTLAMMAILPFYIAVTIYYNRVYKPLNVEYQDVIAEQSAHISEKFSNIQTVKAYSTEQSEIQNYKTINKKSYSIAKKKIFVQGFYMTCSTFLPFVGTMIVLWYGGKLAIEGNAQITPGQLTSFIMYATYMANNTSGISSSYSNIINGTSAVQKVFDMMNYQPQINQEKGMNIQIDGQITFQNVEFKYPTSFATLFNNLCFTIQKGQYVSFVGQSGSGKSTIIKLIEKFYKLSNGKIFFGKVDSEKLNMRNLRKQIGMVNQQATIFSGTIEENISYGLDNYAEQDLINAAKRAGCLEFILNQRLFPDGFKTLLGQKGCNLSGGQRQRISIARALMRKPKIIIFDQATSALDSNSQKMVQQSIQNLAKNDNRQITIIVIAHRLSTVINADRILVMKEGKIIEQGKHEDLKQKKGYYYELVEKQLQDV